MTFGPLVERAFQVFVATRNSARRRRALQLAYAFYFRTLKHELLFGGSVVPPREGGFFGRSPLYMIVDDMPRARLPIVSNVTLTIKDDAGELSKFIDRINRTEVVPVKPTKHYADLNDDWRGKKGKFR